MLKIALVGVGGISGEHIPVWDKMERAELSAICDIRPEQMERYPEKRKYTDFNEMLEKEEIDILDICLPTYLHADFAVRAMERGIHVICEKPISLKEEDVARVYSTAKKMNVNLMVAQVLRFWSEYELIKEIYDTGKYGKLGLYEPSRDVPEMELGQLDARPLAKRSCAIRPARPRP